MISLKKNLFLIVICCIFVIPATLAQSLDFYLVDASSDQDLFLLEDGTTVTLSQVPQSLNIRVEILDQELATETESIKFEFNGYLVRTENFAPYALGGDNSGNFRSFPLPHRTNTLTVKLFSQNNGNGELLLERTLYFSVVEDSSENLPPVFTAPLPPPDFACKGEVLTYFFESFDPDAGGLAYTLDPRSQTLPEYLTLDESTGELSGLVLGDPGSSSFFELEVRIADEDGYFITVPFLLGVLDCGVSGPLQALAGITVVDADRDTDIFSRNYSSLMSGEDLTLDLNTLPEQLNLRADINPLYLPVVRSVEFEIIQLFPFATIHQRVENVLPYALGGDNSEDYFNFTFPEGEYLLFIKIYPEFSAQGIPIQQASFNLVVTQGTGGNMLDIPSPIAVNQSTHLQAYPNPFRDNLTIVIENQQEQMIHLQMVDLWGRKVWEDKIMVFPGSLQWPLQLSHLEPGTYFLRDLTNGQSFKLEAL